MVLNMDKLGKMLRNEDNEPLVFAYGYRAESSTGFTVVLKAECQVIGEIVRYAYLRHKDKAWRIKEIARIKSLKVGQSAWIMGGNEIVIRIPPVEV